MLAASSLVGRCSADQSCLSKALWASSSRASFERRIHPISSVVSKLVHWFKYTAIPWYTSLGFSKGTITLEIAGRKTGKPTRVSLTAVRRGGSRYLVSLYNQSQWVKNVRAAEGRATILSGGKTPVRLVEISQEERAPILLGYVQQRAFSHSGEESAKLFFGLGLGPRLADMEAIADRYVVFQIETRQGMENFQVRQTIKEEKAVADAEIEE